MLNFYIRLIALTTLAFTALSIATRTIGTTQPPNPALAGFRDGCEDKPQPCWYGVVPGKTMIDEVEGLLTKQGLHFRSAGGWRDKHFVNYEGVHRASACRVQFEDANNTVVGIVLSDCPGLRIGDVLMMVGKPNGLCIPFVQAIGLVYSQGDTAIVMVSRGSIFSPLSTAKQVRMRVNSSLSLMPWTGFMLPPFYDRLPANYSDCYWE